MRAAIVVRCLLLGLLLGRAEATAVSDRPNILLILVDDVGYADVGAFAAPALGTAVDRLFYETPRLDQLARDGIRFTQFYTATVCSPTRASLLTGRMSNRMGLWDAYATVSTAFARSGKSVPPGAHPLDYEPWDVSNLSRTDRAMTVPVAATVLREVQTIPQALTGYHTAMIGKWHLGSHNHEGHRPQDSGFHEVLAYFDGGGSSYHRPFQAKAARSAEWDHPGEPLDPAPDYLSDDIAERVNRFLTRRAAQHAAEPFFLYVSHPAAHQPIQSRTDDLAHFQQKAVAGGWAGHVNPAYAGVLKGMDRSIGAILDRLHELGLSENTVVVFLSDNGGHPRETRNTPLRGGKSMLYEGGIRVPMIVRWPGHAEPGSVCDVPTEVSDLYPTLMEIAGLDTADFHADPTTDGESLQPLLADPTNQQHGYSRDAFHWFYGKRGYPGLHDFSSWAALRRGDYKLHFDYQGKVELYDLAADVGETSNLARVEPQRALDMLDELTAWLQANCPPVYLPAPNPEFDPNGPLPFGPYVPLPQLRAELQRLARMAAEPSGVLVETAIYKQVDGRDLHLFSKGP